MMLIESACTQSENGRLVVVVVVVGNPGFGFCDHRRLELFSIHTNDGMILTSTRTEL
jgi:hypothetical protein